MGRPPATLDRCPVSLKWKLSRSVPEDTARCGKLFPEDGLHRTIGDRFGELFPDESAFASLYCTTGRSAISPLLLALVTVLQMLERVPDRTAAEWVVSRMDWKYALHLPLDYPGFHHTALHAFRQRLLAHGEEALVFDRLLSRLQEMGLIQPHGRVRTDSTHVVAQVNRLSQWELVHESLRDALGAVEREAPAWAEEVLPAACRETYAQRQSDFHLSRVEIQRRLRQAGRDGFWFLARVAASNREDVNALSEVVLLQQVLAQQFPAGGEEPPAAKRPAGGEVIETPHDPQVRMATKRQHSWLGFKAHITESCEDDLPAFITDVAVTLAPTFDGKALPGIQERLRERGLVPAGQYVDASYVSGDSLVASAAQGITLWGEVQPDHGGPPGFRQQDFAIDEAQGEARCPRGARSVSWSPRAVAGAQDPLVQVRFAGSVCQACPDFGRCTDSVHGRSLTLNAHRRVLAERREEAATPAFRREMRRRAGIEGTISELVRAHGQRHTRYRGLKKLRLQTLFTAVAANLKRLVRWWRRSAGAAERAPAAA